MAGADDRGADRRGRLIAILPVRLRRGSGQTETQKFPNDGWAKDFALQSLQLKLTETSVGSGSVKVG